MIHIDEIHVRSEVNNVENTSAYVYDIETLGLQPLTDRILCIVLRDCLTGTTMTFAGADEKEILEDFWKRIKPNDVLIGYNNDNFDMPFIVKRSLLHGVVMKKTQSIDLYKVVNSNVPYNSNNKMSTGRLRDWAAMFDWAVNTQDGNLMPLFFVKNQWTEIVEHCREDVEITNKLYLRCMQVNLL